MTDGLRIRTSGLGTEVNGTGFALFLLYRNVAQCAAPTLFGDAALDRQVTRWSYFWRRATMFQGFCPGVHSLVPTLPSTVAEATGWLKQEYQTNDTCYQCKMPRMW